MWRGRETMSDMERIDEAMVLSPAGESRREAILEGLQAAMRGRVWRRGAIRGGIVAALVVAGGSILVLTQRAGSHTVSQRLANAGAAPRSEGGLVMRNASFRIILTSPSAMPETITAIDDEALLSELRAIGHPTGMIRSRGAVVLTADLGTEPDKQTEGAG